MSNPTPHDPIKKVWFVVDMTERWKKHLITRGRKPTKIYKIWANAVREAHRLSIKYPNHHWALFECVGFFTLDLPNRSESNVEAAGKCEPILEVR